MRNMKNKMATITTSISTSCVSSLTLDVIIIFKLDNNNEEQQKTDEETRGILKKSSRISIRF